MKPFLRNECNPIPGEEVISGAPGNAKKYWGYVCDPNLESPGKKMLTSLLRY